MTDTALARLPALEQVTRVHLEGSNQVTGQGLLHLARMPQLEDLDVGGWHSPITDRGLEALRSLPALRTFAACWSRLISDAGVEHLARCDNLESVNLMGHANR